jgi:hypothetical protein
MKRWAIVTVLLYLAFLVLLTGPLLLTIIPDDLSWKVWADGMRMFLGSPWYLLYLGIFAVAQATLLLIPVAITERRPVRRRALLVPVVTTAFLIANLALAGAVSILCVCYGDKGLELINVPAEWSATVMAQVPSLTVLLARWGMSPGPDFFGIANILGLLLIAWLVWGLVFYHFAKADEPQTLVQRGTRWLLRGSILELLVAIPSHIILRQRSECCAPFATFWGLASGISVMLVAFGPGVLFLFAARMRRGRAGAAKERVAATAPPNR